MMEHYLTDCHCGTSTETVAAADLDILSTSIAVAWVYLIWYL